MDSEIQSYVCMAFVCSLPRQDLALVGEKGSGKSAIVPHLSFLSLNFLSKLAVTCSRSVHLRPCLATGGMLMISSELAGTVPCCMEDPQSLLLPGHELSRPPAAPHVGPEDATASRHRIRTHFDLRTDPLGNTEWRDSPIVEV